MTISLIAAVSENGAIGRKGELPWYIPEDLEYFKWSTLGKTVIMGRKTYESLGKPLPGRVNIVLSRQPGLVLSGCVVSPDFDTLLQTYQEALDWMIIGGAGVYELALPYVHRLYLTEVHTQVKDADTYFPDWDRAAFREIHREDKFGKQGIDYSFVIYESVRPRP
jgi:dihydrofolate reductase